MCGSSSGGKQQWQVADAALPRMQHAIQPSSQPGEHWSGGRLTTALLQAHAQQQQQLHVALRASCQRQCTCQPAPPSSLCLPARLLLPRRRGKNENEEKRELIFKEDGQEYAQVLRMLGNGRLEAQCIDGIKRLCHIRGKMRKKVWVNQGDIILVGLRDYQDAKGDVILKYMADEARSLKQYGELPENIRVNDTDAMMEGEENENAECVGAQLGGAGEAAWRRRRGQRQQQCVRMSAGCTPSWHG